MSTQAAPAPFIPGVIVRRILAVEPQPHASHLDYVVFDGVRALEQKGDFKAGALAVHIPSNAVLPVWVLQRLGLWDEKAACGKLAGPKGNLVLPGHRCDGLCYPVKEGVSPDDGVFPDEADRKFYFIEVNKGVFGVSGFVVHEGDDVEKLLGIHPFSGPM